jgi:hypothetical protein
MRFPAIAWAARITVIETIYCNEANRRFRAPPLISAEAVYSADWGKDKTAELDLVQLSKWYADSEIVVERHEDGRLKSINTSTAGAGEPIFRAVAATLPLLGQGALSVPPVALQTTQTAGAAPTPEPKDPVCVALGNLGQKQAPATLVFVATAKPNLKPESEALEFEQTAGPSDKALLEAFKPSGKNPAVTGDCSKTESQRFLASPGGSTDLQLRLQDVITVELTVQAAKQPGLDIGPAKRTLVVPTTKRCVDVPIPRPPLFGKQGFQLALAPAGQILKLGYSSTSGVAAAMSGANALVASQSAETEAKQLKAEADLIAARERLLLCQADPAKCK